MEKRSFLRYALAASAVFWAFGLSTVQTGQAVEEHHQQDTKEKAPASSESQGSEKKPGPAAGGGSGMMAKMHGSGDEEGRGMMGQGMMRVMMSHMTGGPCGMKKMMGQMGSGMKGCGDAPRGMARMARTLDNLDLSPDQWSQVRNLARKRLEKMADLWAQRMKLRIELAALRWDDDIDPQRVKDLFVRRAEAQAEMFIVSLDYLHKLKSVLTQEQIETLEDQGL